MKKAYHNNGNIFKEWEVNEKGQPHGLLNRYHENGQLEVYISFVNGIQIDGDLVSYHDGGSKARKTTRLNGAFSGDFSE